MQACDDGAKGGGYGGSLVVVHAQQIECREVDGEEYEDCDGEAKPGVKRDVLNNVVGGCGEDGGCYCHCSDFAPEAWDG